MNQDPSQEYMRDSESGKHEKGYAWWIGIGLRAVDKLKVSDYLLHTTVRSIEGEISFQEAKALLQSYYEEHPSRNFEDHIEEAGKVSVRTAELLSERASSFIPQEYIPIYRKLFAGVYSHTGRLRNCNITKQEWILDGASVPYGDVTELRVALDYDSSEEKNFSYKGLSMDEMIRHLAGLLSRPWQIHVLGEGNVRVTVILFIKYLSTLGFEVTNDAFAENAWYSRNALVWANHSDLKKGIYETTAFLEPFLRDLLLSEHHPLRNRILHISWSSDEAMKPDIGIEKPDIGEVKPDIESERPDADERKPDIGATKPDIMAEFLPKTVRSIRKLREASLERAVSRRIGAMKVLGLKVSEAFELLMKIRKSGIVETVSGQGKGKYRFILFS